jgi:hypothetical protein
MLELTKTKNIMNKISELEFGADFINTGAVSRLCSTGFVLTELETIHGIPDAVLILKQDVDSLEALHSKFGAVYLTSSHARIMTSLYGKKFQDLKTIANKCGLSVSYTRSILKSLVENELIYSADGRYRLSDSYGMPKVQIISIEFKLTDWKKALNQALRHSSFASKSYVIMPSSKKDVLKKHSNIFKDYGVSVVTYDTESKKLDRIVEARPNRHSKVSYVDSLFKVVNNFDRALVPAN